MTNAAALDLSTITAAGIPADHVAALPDGTFVATDDEGFDIEFGWDDDHDEWFTLSEAGAPGFGTMAELLAYVREFVETPANL